MKIQYYLLVLYSIFSMLACNDPVEMLETTEVYATKHFGFSQAVVVNGLLYTSGQVGWDTSYHLTGNKSFDDQLKQSFLNIQNLLKASPATMGHIVLLRFYVKNLDDVKRIAVGKNLKKYFKGDYKPATSLIGVSRLAREDLLLEIEVVAKINNGPE